MRKIVFIASHLESGSSVLYSALNQNSRVQGFSNSHSYEHPLNLLYLTEMPHKLNNTAAVYMDHLLYDYNLGTRVALEKCKFIYVIREASAALNRMVLNHKKPSFAERYYSLRLQRLSEMARFTPEAIFLTWEDLMTGRKLDLIEDYLRLKEPLVLDQNLLNQLNVNISTELVPANLRQTAERSYESAFRRLKSRVR